MLAEPLTTDQVSCASTTAGNAINNTVNNLTEQETFKNKSWRQFDDANPSHVCRDCRNLLASDFTRKVYS